MSDEITIDTSGFNAGMEGLVRRLKIDPKTVVIKEAGELMKTLVKVTPPADPSKTREKISTTIAKKFSNATDSRAALDDSDQGSFFANAMSSAGKVNKTNVDPTRSYNGTTYFAATPQALYGFTDDKDLRKASVETLRKLLYQITPKGKQTYQFTHPRKQKVRLHQNVVTDHKTVAKLIQRIEKHVGRLKAGWLAAWTESGGVIPITGSQFLPPKWVTRHARGARGRYVDGLGVENFPTFSIGNSAEGVNDKRGRVKFFVQSALGIRAKAMRENTRLIFVGRKNLADYAKGQALVLKD